MALMALKCESPVLRREGVSGGSPGDGDLRSEPFDLSDETGELMFGPLSAQ